MENALISRACELFGGQTAMARRLSRRTGKPITQQRVANWINRGDEVPVEFLAAIEAESGGEITRRQLRPDDWHSIWPELVSASGAQSEESAGQ